jgi:5,10-methylenetetrahydromethanopterin reductase
MQISCSFPTTLDTPEHVRIAEQLGYSRAWLYDTPQQSPDVWMALALTAERTERIGLGPGVLIPSLRHPMVNAAGTAGLVALAPGRVAVGFGTGFTGRRAMGYGSISWGALERYIAAYVALLQGETIVWEGARMRMLHPDGSAPARPIEVPLIISAFGPKGTEITNRLGYGLFAAPGTFPAGVFDWVACIRTGTVRDDGDADSPLSEREIEAIGAGWALPYHLTYEYAGPDAVATMPGGEAWLARVGESAENERHLAIHTNHLLAMNDADRAAWDAGGSVMADQLTVTGTAAHVRGRVAELAESGVTELVYQPLGPDIAGELERFIAAAL